jgi:leucyl-tRNA synthetase
MIQGKTYRYFTDDAGADADAPARCFGHGEVRVEGEAFVHRETGQELAERWVAPDEVRWIDGTPMHPDGEVRLEEVVERMSKSRGNVVNPDDVIAEYGAVSMRLYQMFLGPLEKAAPWQTEGIPGVFRFLQRAYRLVMDDHPEGEEDSPRALDDGPGTEEQQRLLARAVDKVSREIESLDLNTAISQLMIFVREVEKQASITRPLAESFVLLLSPFAPHVAEELWEALGHPESLAYEPWPEADPAKLATDEVEIAVQVQGKVRGRVRVPADADSEAVADLALAEENVRKHVGDQTPRRVIYVPGRLVNFVL